jgi:hypothetical protein
MLRRWVILILGLLLVNSSCARGGGDGSAQPVDRPVRVEVTNNHALPMAVYAVGSGITHRMGTVHPGMEGNFVVPQNLLGSGGVELQARPNAAERAFRSGQLLLAPGTIVVFMISPQLFNSTVTLRQ